VSGKHREVKEDLKKYFILECIAKDTSFKDNDFYFRLKAWIERCQNEEVASQPLQLVCRKYYICSDHFCARNFTGQNKKRLKAGVIPSFFLKISEHDEEPAKIIHDEEERDDHVEMPCLSGTEREQHINNDGTLVSLEIMSWECHFKKVVKDEA